jgi:Transposase DDE domain
MDPRLWQEQLIGLFCYVSQQYRAHLWVQAQRFSPNATPRFSDEEVLTVYVFGLWQHLNTVAAIHAYTRAHLAAWFPHLPSYAGFVQRLNRLPDLLAALGAQLLERSAPEREAAGHTWVVDSLPILLAQQVRSGRARVAPEAADKGYCGSKKQYYYGVKLHLLGQHRPGALPRPELVILSRASEGDLPVLKLYSHCLPPGELFADKIYRDQQWQADLDASQHLRLHTPIKRKVGQESLDAADRLYSRAVSRVRQPIESLFHWIDEKTGIQAAFRVRSTAGLWVHVFGRLAAALLLLALNS